MFGDKKTSKPVSNSTENYAANVIQNGTSINGTVDSKGNIRVDGKIEGTLTTAAKLVVGKTGEIVGDVVCQNASVEGKIVGTLKVTELLSLRSSARIEGDMTTKKLVVEEGAIFDGTCNMGAKVQKANVANNGTAYQKQAV